MAVGPIRIRSIRKVDLSGSGHGLGLEDGLGVGDKDV